jgi:uncharacterized protein
MLARPVSNRIVKRVPIVGWFKPQGIPMRHLEKVQLTVDEYEAIRLADLEGMYQEDAAKEMQISRQTFGRILDSAHHKIADTIINGKSLYIGGGSYFIEGERTLTCGCCKHTWAQSEKAHAVHCPMCANKQKKQKAAGV